MNASKYTDPGRATKGHVDIFYDGRYALSASVGENHRMKNEVIGWNFFSANPGTRISFLLSAGIAYKYRGTGLSRHKNTTKHLRGKCLIETATKLRALVALSLY